MRGLFQIRRSNAVRSWLAAAVVPVATLWSLVDGKAGWTLFGVALVAILLAPAIAHRSTDVVPPATVVLVAAVPFTAGVLVPAGPAARGAAYVTVAASALVVAVQTDLFTSVAMNRGFGVAFVVLTTTTAAGAWELGQWIFDLVAGTELVGDNDAVMWRLIWASATGVAAGVAFDRYLHRSVDEEFVPDGFDLADADDQVESTADAASAAFERVGITQSHQQRLARGAQGLLGLIVAVGLVTLNLDVVVNGTIGIAATFVPTLVKRDHDVHVDVGLTLWIAIAVVFHAMGTLWFYQTVWGWHNLAHAVSGTLVAAVGYTLVRAVETHTRAVSFPPRFTFVLVVVFVFSIGVFWEIAEFTLDAIAAAFGTEDLVLAQHGLTDTMSDLLANTVGALVVAGVATAYRLR